VWNARYSCAQGSDGGIRVTRACAILVDEDTLPKAAIGHAAENTMQPYHGKGGLPFKDKQRSHRAAQVLVTPPSATGAAAILHQVARVVRCKRRRTIQDMLAYTPDPCLNLPRASASLQKPASSPRVVAITASVQYIRVYHLSPITASKAGKVLVGT